MSELQKKIKEKELKLIKEFLHSVTLAAINTAMNGQPTIRHTDSNILHHWLLLLLEISITGQF